MSSKEKPGWKNLTIGGVLLEPGTSRRYRTGDWRADLKPVVDRQKCTNCLLCWVYCPEPTIHRREGWVEIDYTYCKGCGICAEECPVKAISMVGE